MKNNKLLLIVAHLNIYNNSTNVTAHINRTHAVRRIKYIYLVVLSQFYLLQITFVLLSSNPSAFLFY